MITLHSTVNPVAEGERLAESVSIGPDGLLVVLGLGLGYHVEAALKKATGRPVVIVEKEPEVWRAALTRIDLKTWIEDRDLYFIIGDEPEHALARLSTIQLKHKMSGLTLMIHQPSFRAFPNYYDPIALGIETAEKAGVSEKLRYQKFREDGARILILHSRYYLVGEIINSLRRMGHTGEFVLVDKEGEARQEVMEGIIARIITFHPDFILTVNHLGFDREGFLTQFFTDIEMPHASWFVDSPLFTLEDYAEQHQSDYLTLFVWDEDYVADLKKAGFNRTFYLPLGTDPDIFRPVANRDNRLYHLKCEVGFVGNSMTNAMQKTMDDLKPDGPLRAFVEKAAHQFIRSKERHVRNLISEWTKAQIGTWDAMTQDEQGYFERAVTWRATQIYRHQRVRALLPFNLHVHGDPGWEDSLNGRAVIRKELNYYDDLPLFYNVCDVNFNATSLQMKGAVNQRIFDVPACGGFLLTDYRPQVDALFRLEEEIVCYKGVDDISELAGYYLRHPEKRERVARKARNRIMKNHTYVHRLEELIGRMRSAYA